MNKLKVGYWPLSSNLKSAGDRRRVVFWAQARGHEIITDLSQKVDVVIASEKSDFNSLAFSKSKAPVIFDLVDAYLAPLNPLDDLARGVAKSLSGEISGEVRPFSNHIRNFCLRADGVICSSIEQEDGIRKYNSNTHVILDSHEELPFIDAKFSEFKNRNEIRVLWEGQPATIRGVRNISSSLQKLSENNSLHLDFVTDENYFQFLGKYVKRSTLSLLVKDLSEISSIVSITPWTLSNLIKSAKLSSLAMIPVDISVPMQYLKPENRLLIMWRLGLPCLTSSSPAYLRVSSKAGVSATCNDSNSWISGFSRLINDSKFAHNEILKGQDYLRNFHTRNILLDKWDKAIESVLY
jgi:hypothetical protein